MSTGGKDSHDIDTGDGERTPETSYEDDEAPNSIVLGEELQDDDASDEQLISGGMPD